MMCPGPSLAGCPPLRAIGVITAVVALFVSDMARTALTAATAAPERQARDSAGRADGREGPAAPAVRSGSADQQLAFHRKPDERGATDLVRISEESRVFGSPLVHVTAAEMLIVRRPGLLSGRNAPLRL
jgi:hypothetical protein